MTACKGCGKEIRWAVDMNTGARIPLDAKPLEVYVIVGDGSCCKAPPSYISHFKTCPKADQFSGRNQKKADPQGELGLDGGK